ncbi:hypothetical protein GE061_015338 [Apolygus lucorum]|uniref:Uncharacterized protein n=1 Tax=Apolygus lucorum TaxID=248454 RepID=A0A8S9XKP2_APOLU|nr:hypothetical protein GE061_015338 [Apolygus lucorum]
MPPKRFSYSMKMAFAAMNAYFLYRAEPQSFDAKKFFSECAGKDDMWHTLMRIVLIHYSSEFRPKRPTWEDSDFDSGCRVGCFPTPAEIAKRAESRSILRRIEPCEKKQEE